MPQLKCSGTGPVLDCSVDGTPLTCNRVAKGILICRDEDGDIQPIIGQDIQPSPAATATETKDPSLASLFDELLEELYNNLKNGGSNFDTLRDAFEVIGEIARTDPDLALEKIEDIRSYAIESNSVDTQRNCDLFTEVITHIKDPNYGLDYANELVGQNGIAIDPQDPLTGLSEKLYPPLPQADIFIEAIKGPAFNQGLILIAPQISAKGFNNLNSYINKLPTPSSEEE